MPIEFKNALRQADLGFTKKEINALLNELDVDSDGKVTYEEFIPMAHTILIELIAEQYKNNHRPAEEIGQFLVGLFAREDPDNAGVMKMSAIKNILVEVSVVGDTYLSLLIVLTIIRDYILF